MTFAEKLLSLRTAAKLSQAELAARAGIHSMQVSKFERGASQPSFATVCQIAAALGVELSEFDPRRKLARTS